MNARHGLGLWDLPSGRTRYNLAFGPGDEVSTFGDRWWTAVLAKCATFCNDPWIQCSHWIAIETMCVFSVWEWWCLSCDLDFSCIPFAVGVYRSRHINEVRSPTCGFGRSQHA